MKISKPVTVCNSCGSESLDSKAYAVVTLTIDGHVEYLTDICRELCLPKLVELGRRSADDLAPTGELVEAKPVKQLDTCVTCGRSFKSEAGLRVHIARMHTN